LTLSSLSNASPLAFRMCICHCASPDSDLIVENRTGQSYPWWARIIIRSSNLQECQIQFEWDWSFPLPRAYGRLRLSTVQHRGVRWSFAATRHHPADATKPALCSMKTPLNGFLKSPRFWQPA
jgi:hypothetical protein